MNRLVKIFQFKPLLILITGSFILISCEKQLEEKLYDRALLQNYYQTDDQVYEGLVGLYSRMTGNGWHTFMLGGENALFAAEEAQADIVQLRDNWLTDPSHKSNQFYTYKIQERNSILTNNWEACYQAIAVANSLIENVPNASQASESLIREVLAESYAMRGLMYSVLHNTWGSVPIISESPEDLFAFSEKSSKELVAAQAEKDLLEALNNIPDVNYIDAGTEHYGRFTKAGVQAMLAKYYLNLKQWDKCAAISKEIIENPNYELYQGDYFDLFAVDNSLPGPAKELLVVISGDGLRDAGTFIPNALFQSFQRYFVRGDSTDSFPFSGIGWWYAQSDFYDTFDPLDIRREGLLREWIDINYDTNSFEDGRAVVVKWEPDLDAAEWFGRTDNGIIRMADIYLARAEALNELQGPNQESIDLINAVRARAFEPDKPVSLADFPSKELLNDHILKERGWELYFENHRRLDLIRHGKLLDIAMERGVANPTEDLYVYPIPYDGVRSINPTLDQNPGY